MNFVATFAGYVELNAVRLPALDISIVQLIVIKEFKSCCFGRDFDLRGVNQSGATVVDLERK